MKIWAGTIWSAGRLTFAAGVVPDFALTRATGDPLYTLVNPVDDALMKITHVLRGEDLLPSTPRQIALYQALIRIGIADRVPEFAHLPTVLGEGTRKLSKRDPQSNLFAHRDRGFIPEGLLNYLALLGWAIAADRDVFSLDEMVAAFDVVDVNANPARFDQKKADAINAEHIRLLDVDDFTGRLRDYFNTHGHHTGLDDARFAVAAGLVQTRIVVLGDAWDLLKFFNDDEYTIDPKAAAKELGSDAGPVLDAAVTALDGLAELDGGRYRGRPQRRVGRGARAQTAQGFRPDPGGDHRIVGQPAAVRVDGAAWTRAQSAAAAGSRRPGRAQVRSDRIVW